MGKITCLMATTVTTKKANKKEMRNLRIADDDQRRFKILFKAVAEAYAEHKPHAVAYEVYQPFPGKTASSAWKTARIEGMIQGMMLVIEALVLPFIPYDLKSEMTGKRSASKAEIEDAVVARVDGLFAELSKLKKDKVEHASDAAGYALLAFEEMDQIRKIAGVS